MRKVIFNLLNEHKGNWTKVYDSILYKEKPTVNVTGEENNNMYDNSLFITDDEYSDKFKKMYMPPFALFYHGNIELINEKVLSILGNIKTSDIEKLKSIKSADYTICLFENDTNKETINELTKNGFKVIVLTDKKIDYKNKVNNEIVYISEFCTDKIDTDEKLVIKRLMYAIGDEILLKDKTIENIEIIITNYKNEHKKCFLINDAKDEEEIKSIDYKIFSSINRIEEIIELSKS